MQPPDPYLVALAVLCYLYPPGATADGRRMVRFYAAREIRRTVRLAS
jgi:hypothetical protein